MAKKKVRNSRFDAFGDESLLNSSENLIDERIDNTAFDEEEIAKKQIKAKKKRIKELEKELVRRDQEEIKKYRHHNGIHLVAWKYILTFVCGFVFFPLSIGLGLLAAGAYLETDDIVEQMGGNPSEIIGEDLADQTLLETIVTVTTYDYSSLKTLNDIYRLSPYVEQLCGSLDEAIDNMGIVFNSDATTPFNWETIKDVPLEDLGSHIADSFAGGFEISLAKLFKNEIDSGNKFVRYICYTTDQDGNEVERGLKDLLNLNGIIEGMKLTDILSEDEINRNKVYKELADLNCPVIDIASNFSKIHLGNLLNEEEQKTALGSYLIESNATLDNVGKVILNAPLISLIDLKPTDNVAIWAYMLCGDYDENLEEEDTTIYKVLNEGNPDKDQQIERLKQFADNNITVASFTGAVRNFSNNMQFRSIRQLVNDGIISASQDTKNVVNDPTKNPVFDIPFQKFLQAAIKFVAGDPTEFMDIASGEYLIK